MDSTLIGETEQTSLPLGCFCQSNLWQQEDKNKTKQKTQDTVHTLQKAMPLRSTWYPRTLVTSQAWFIQPLCFSHQYFLVL